MACTSQSLMPCRPAEEPMSSSWGMLGTGRQIKLAGQKGSPAAHGLPDCHICAPMLYACSKQLTEPRWSAATNDCVQSTVDA